LIWRRCRRVKLRGCRLIICWCINLIEMWIHLSDESVAETIPGEELCHGDATIAIMIKN
jgi:hypothetical protein